MKTSILAASALAAPLCFSTAMAAEPFHAMSGLSLTALTDVQLDAVEGGKKRKHGKKVVKNLEKNCLLCGITLIEANVDQSVDQSNDIDVTANGNEANVDGPIFQGNAAQVNNTQTYNIRNRF